MDDLVTIEIEDEPNELLELDETSETIMVEPFDPSQIKIHTKQDTLRNLIERLRHDEIDLNTEFQRHAELWDAGKMSRLIESILIRFPLPAFYFDSTDDDEWLVVDGLQRLSSIKRFVLDKKRPLKLCQLEYLTDLHGQTYDDLSRTYLRRINECSVTYFQILPGTPEEVKYSIFRRINTGGLVLNNQEIRNALNKPSERKFLKQLAGDKNLRKTMGDQSKRMLDQELALRFLAFYHFEYPDKGMNIATFLDQMMKKLREMRGPAREDLLDKFTLSMERSFKIFGSAAFEKRTAEDADSRRKRKNSTLFEVWAVSLARVSDKTAEKLVENRERVVERNMNAMDPSGPYYRSISLATQKRDHVTIRYKTVNDIISECTT